MSFDSFAGREPHFSALTSEKYLRANLTPEREREFFETGEELVHWIFQIIEARLFPNFSPMSTLEYGCGPGRLAIPLAKRPGSVTAVDQSPAMLAAAADAAARQGVGHIDFRSPDELFAADRRFDLVCCVHVLQRMPPRAGLALLAQLLRRIATGGVGVFQVPYRTTMSPAVRGARWVRERVPVVNGLVNRLRRRPWGDPFIPTHVYPLDDVLATIARGSAFAAQVVFERQGDLDCVIIFVELPLPSTTGVDDRGRPLPGTTLRKLAAHGERPIEVTSIIEGTSPDALNRAAERYFASLRNWDDHLAKPFASSEEAPRLLVNLSTLLHGLHLRPGDTVVDFGAGTGWISRQLTQLGCRVVLLDVSPTALDIARELYRRLPVVGDRPAPEFLPFDGRTIPLPDASVDRILSFDALHHAPDPAALVSEFGRILKPGGVAGFSEPGARHSRSAMSQFEMRTYGVVENDIDVHALWRAARAHGFAAVRLAVFNGPPFYVSLAEYEDFLAGGQTSERWVTATRVHQRDVRNFFLVKAGSEPIDSRSMDGLAATIDVDRRQLEVRPGEAVVLEASVTNTGAARWLGADARYGAVSIGAHLYDADGRLVTFDYARSPLVVAGNVLASGDTVRTTVTLPPLDRGRHRVELDCVASGIAWFSQAGSPTATVQIDVSQPPPPGRA